MRRNQLLSLLLLLVSATLGFASSAHHRGIALVTERHSEILFGVEAPTLNPGNAFSGYWVTVYDSVSKEPVLTRLLETFAARITIPKRVLSYGRNYGIHVDTWYETRAFSSKPPSSELYENTQYGDIYVIENPQNLDHFFYFGCDIRIANVKIPESVRQPDSFTIEFDLVTDFQFLPDGHFYAGYDIEVDFAFGAYPSAYLFEDSVAVTLNTALTHHKVTFTTHYPWAKTGSLDFFLEVNLKLPDGEPEAL